MSSLDRRSFTRALSLTGLAYLGFRLTGCGPTLGDGDTRVAADGTPYVGETVTMYDLRMEAWSTLGSGQLGFTGTLTASQIRANQTLSLPYSQDDHGHTFQITAEHFGRLRRGEGVRILTTEAQGHRHEVRIDPARNRIPGSAGIVMPVDPDAVDPTPPPANPGTQPPAETASLHAALDEQDALYVAGSEPLRDGTAEYCLAPKDRCDADATLWQRMKAHVVGTAQPGRQVYVSERTLTLDANARETPMTVRGRTQAGDRLIVTLLKLMR